MYKIEHIGIAVKNLEDANTVVSRLMGEKPYKQEKVENEGVTTSFFKIGESKLELLESLSEDSPITKFLNQRGEGIHHIAFAVENIKKEVIRLKQEGFQLINEEPRKGADNKWVVFIHPKSTHGILVELCQDISPEEL